jgi:hypothetical protein
MTMPELRVLADRLGYHETYRIAQQSGFIGKRKTRETLLRFIKDFADEEDLVIYNPSYGEDLSKAIPYELCNVGYTPNGASLMIEHKGIDIINNERMPCVGWRVDDVGVSRARDCDRTGLKRPITFYKKRKAEKIDNLEMLDFDDPMFYELEENILKSIKSYDRIVREFPITGRLKCYCGTFKCFVPERGWEILAKREKARKKRIVRARRKAGRLTTDG